MAKTKKKINSANKKIIEINIGTLFIIVGIGLLFIHSLIVKIFAAAIFLFGFILFIFEKKTDMFAGDYSAAEAEEKLDEEFSEGSTDDDNMISFDTDETETSAGSSIFSEETETLDFSAGSETENIPTFEIEESEKDDNAIPSIDTELEIEPVELEETTVLSQPQDSKIAEPAETLSFSDETEKLEIQNFDDNLDLKDFSKGEEQQLDIPDLTGDLAGTGEQAEITAGAAVAESKEFGEQQIDLDLGDIDKLISETNIEADQPLQETEGTTTAVSKQPAAELDIDAESQQFETNIKQLADDLDLDLDKNIDSLVSGLDKSLGDLKETEKDIDLSAQLSNVNLDEGIAIEDIDKDATIGDINKLTEQMEQLSEIDNLTAGLETDLANLEKDLSKTDTDNLGLSGLEDLEKLTDDLKLDDLEKELKDLESITEKIEPAESLKIETFAESPKETEEIIPQELTKEPTLDNLTGLDMGIIEGQQESAAMESQEPAEIVKPAAPPAPPKKKKVEQINNDILSELLSDSNEFNITEEIDELDQMLAEDETLLQQDQQDGHAAVKVKGAEVSEQVKAETRKIEDDVLKILDL
ncbi:MAG TPA: hypothetical protein PLM75_02300 [bacterium]|nr:hypothetical protein [bacterium]